MSKTLKDMIDLFKSLPEESFDEIYEELLKAKEKSDKNKAQ